MSISAFSATLQELIQKNYLQRAMQQAILPAQLFVSGATREKYAGHVGEKIIKSRAGLMTVNTTPQATVSTAPAAMTRTVEQYWIEVKSWSEQMSINKLDSALAIDGQIMQSGEDTAVQAGRVQNTLCRNELFTSYLGGVTRTTGTEAGSPATALVVDEIRGFRFAMSAGALHEVSASYPLAITIGAGLTAASVVAATPADAAVPNGAGTLTLAVGKNWTTNDLVLAANRPTIVRAGAKTHMDAITSSEVPTMNDVMTMASILSTRGVPRFRDGRGTSYQYHIPSAQFKALFHDGDFQSAYKGRYDAPLYQGLGSGADGYMGTWAGISWFMNEECPSEANTTIDVRRSIMFGQDALIKEFMDPMEYSLPGAPSIHQDRNWVDVANGVALPIGDVKFTLQAPTDPNGLIYTLAYLLVAGFACPTDYLGGKYSSTDLALYKRACVYESA